MNSASQNTIGSSAADRVGATKSVLTYDPKVRPGPTYVPVSPAPLFRVRIGTVAACALLSISQVGTATAGPRNTSEANMSFHRARQPALVSEQLLPLYAELAAFAELEDGWDGADSVAPHGDVIQLAAYFLRLLPGNVKLPNVIASADGEVGFYWKSPGVYIDVGFPRPGRISYYAEAHGRVARGSGLFTGDVIAQELLDVIAQA